MKRRDFLTISVKSAMAAGLTAAVPVSLLRLKKDMLDVFRGRVSSAYSLVPYP